MKKLFVLLLISLLTFTTVSAATTISTDITTGGKIGISSTTPYAKLAVDNTVTPSGNELITNGTFTGGTTGWTLGGNVTYGSNNVVSTYAGGDPSLSTTFATVSGRTYLVTFTISGSNDLMLPYFVNNTLSYDDSNGYNDGSYAFAFTTDYTGTETIVFDSYNYINGATWTLDSVSIKEISKPTPALVIMGFDGKNILSIGGDILGNTSIGMSSFVNNTRGVFNSAFGARSLSSNTTGTRNTAIGSDSLRFNSTGRFNTGNGLGSLFLNTSGDGNTASGLYSLYSNVSGSNNTAYGRNSLNLVTGSGNVALGYSAGSWETGSNAFYVGNQNYSNSALEKAGSLLYGTFNATPSSQTLTINASTTIAQNLKVGGNSNSANLQVKNTANATTTVEMGSTGQNKGSCLKMYRTDGSAIYAYVAAGATTFTLSTTACASVSNF